MRPRIGVRHEDKNRWERRAPLTPDHVSTLVEQHDLEVLVEPSQRRIFSDEAYRAAGATLSSDLGSCPVVIGVKEIPPAKLVAGQGYLYFSHVIKGQAYNMGMLRTLLERGCHLMDYEKVTDDDGCRLILFGRYAGLAGMIDTLWGLGQRLALEGIASPLAEVKRAHAYADLDEVRAHFGELGARLAAEGIPAPLRPLVVGFSGYGNVSQGAQEILDLLPHVEVSPAQLGGDDLGAADPATQIIKVVFREEDMVRPREADQAFELQEYYDHPERYRGDFARFLPRLSVLVNCIYWDNPYPVLLSRDDARQLAADPSSRLRAIGDISCDIEGGVEITLKPTTVDEPCFVYDPATDSARDGVEGPGLLVMAIDNLPCELPADASRSFGDALVDFVPALANADYTAPLDQLALPAALTRALIVHQGRLTPDYVYLNQYLERAEQA